MKRFLALLLALAVWMSLFTLSVSASEKNNAQAPSAITNLKITTANKKKLLKLTWDRQPQADGYQVYRSTTGKSGSYKKIATLQNKSVYVDKDLKAAKTYYYAVRAFYKTSEKTVFGSFAKVNLSTRLTKSYLQKLIQKANKVSLGWTMNALDEHDALDMSDQRVFLVFYGDGNYADEQTFARIRSKRYHSVKDIENDLACYYDESLYQDYINDYYRDFDGKLYGIVGDTGGDYHGTEGKLKIVSVSDTAYRIDVKDIGRYFGEETICVEKIKLTYKNGRWLFHDLLSNWGLFDAGSKYWK